MKDYDAFLFDWDGTLVQMMEVWVEVIRKHLNKHSIDLSDYEIAHGFVGRLPVGASEVGLKGKDHEKFVAQVIDDGYDRMPTVPLYPDALDMLQLLHKNGKKLALVTTSYARIIDVVLSRHKLLNLFNIVIVGDQVKRHKPDPEGILLALKSLGVKKEKAIMVGDSEKDLAAAQNAEIDSLLFYPPSHKLFYDLDFLKKYNPTYIINSWQKLMDKVK